MIISSILESEVEFAINHVVIVLITQRPVEAALIVDTRILEIDLQVLAYEVIEACLIVGLCCAPVC